MLAPLSPSRNSDEFRYMLRVPLRVPFETQGGVIKIVYSLMGV